MQKSLICLVRIDTSHLLIPARCLGKTQIESN